MLTLSYSFLHFLHLVYIWLETTFGTVQKWSLRPLLDSPKGGLNIRILLYYAAHSRQSTSFNHSHNIQIQVLSQPFIALILKGNRYTCKGGSSVSIFKNGQLLKERIFLPGSKFFPFDWRGLAFGNQCKKVAS